MSNMQNIVVIGSGLAGISVAIRLKKRGYQVTVIEKNETYGGKLASFSESGFRWDKGPSLFTQPYLVDELFEICGKNPRDYFSYSQFDTTCNYVFDDGLSLQFYADEKKMVSEITSKISTAAANSTINYLKKSKKTYNQVGDFFISKSKLKANQLLNPELIKRYPALMSSKLRKSLHSYNKSLLNDEKLVQIFDRFGTYNGSSPFQMSGLYSLIPHLEQNEGTFFPNKGMRSIVDSLYQLAVEMGVNFQFNTQIEEIKYKQETYLVNTEYEKLQADKLICAIDHLSFYKYLLKDEKSFVKYNKQERSSSGIVMYLGINKRIENLGLHTIIFSKNYAHEFDTIFKLKQIPDDPTFYVHVSNSFVKEDAPDGGQNLFVMINTPPEINCDNNKLNELKLALIHKLKLHFGVDITNHIVVEKYWTPSEIESFTGTFTGALYGASSNHKLSALKRHGNQNRKYKNLYFCGGTVHPGGGIPLVLKSSAIVSELVNNGK